MTINPKQHPVLLIYKNIPMIQMKTNETTEMLRVLIIGSSDWSLRFKRNKIPTPN
ncbi:hypothetical protein [Candidatus Hodgkinia cicadicola]|uniref:hypothetical protein n=1 Tax=Candidatus Hodgkinia cicadicola TaxID=573658 RepID=UPI001788DA69